MTTLQIIALSAGCTFLGFVLGVVLVGKIEQGPIHDDQGRVVRGRK